MAPSDRGLARLARDVFRRPLRCSFCGRSEREVAKLVAGPRVFICDACVATCHKIVSAPGPEDAPRS